MIRRNLQAIIDGVKGGVIRNTKIVGVISNNKNAYALERARENHIPAKCISPKDYESRDVFNEKLLEAVNEYGTGSDRFGRISCCYPSGNDRGLQKPDD